MKKNLLWILLVLFSGCNTRLNEDDYLKEVSGNLDKIRSASYFSTQSESAPGETVKLNEIKNFYKIYINPYDTLVGSSSATFSEEDTTKLTGFYDGNAKGYVYWDEQYIMVDSFHNDNKPFRLVYYPFYTKVNEIIKYSLNTKDGINTDFVDYGDSVYFSLKIVDKHVYFNIKPIIIKNGHIPENVISQFDIWINKSNNMPYRMNSKWYHTTFSEAISEVKFNTLQDTSLNASKYYPIYFKIVESKSELPQPNNEMVGKQAPNWILKDIDNNEDVGLSNIKSKVLLIQFTGVGCGPCHKSIPFLKELVKDYKEKDFEFVSIEIWSNNIEGLKKYKETNDFNFKFLNSTDEVIKSYEVSYIPTFFIIDENRIIREVINGYNEENTDNEIKENIDKYL